MSTRSKALKLTRSTRSHANLSASKFHCLISVKVDFQVTGQATGGRLSRGQDAPYEVVARLLMLRRSQFP